MSTVTDSVLQFSDHLHAGQIRLRPGQIHPGEDSMDINSLRVTEHTSRIRRILGFCAVAGLAIALSACGGGGGGGGGGGNPAPTPTGSVSVTVTDANGLVVSGATVVATVSNVSKTATSNASGVATLTDVRTGNGNLAVSRDTFKPKTVAVAVTENQTTSVTVALERDTKATGGLLSARVLTGKDTATLQFEIQVVVVDENSSAVSGLTAGAFSLASCTPNAATVDTPDCLSDGSSTFDAPYTVTGPGPAPSFQEVPGGIAKAYAAALLFDQSLSIKTNDPTDARLYSARVFLDGLGGADRASLSALAYGNAALIPEKPVTIYPVGNPGFVADGSIFYPTLEALATQEGGQTPLYEGLCQVMDFSAANAPPGLDKAVIVFTDGKNDGNPAGAACKTADESIAKSAGTGVDIYTVGLSGEVDGQTLAALADGGNGAFMFAEDTAQLVTIYGSLGNLLSGSLTTYKLTYTITTNAAGGFASGRSVLGRLNVNTGAGTVTLPIVVRIF